jgi:hypothetical protein
MEMQESKEIRTRYLRGDEHALPWDGSVWELDPYERDARAVEWLKANGLRIREVARFQRHFDGNTVPVRMTVVTVDYVQDALDGSAQRSRGRPRILDSQEDVMDVCELYYLTDMSVSAVARRKGVSTGVVDRVLRMHGRQFFEDNREAIEGFRARRRS